MEEASQMKGKGVGMKMEERVGAWLVAKPKDCASMIGVYAFYVSATNRCAGGIDAYHVSERGGVGCWKGASID